MVARVAGSQLIGQVGRVARERRSPAGAERAAPPRLSASQLLRFERRGWTCTRQLFAPDELSEFLPALEAELNRKELDAWNHRLEVLHPGSPRASSVPAARAVLLKSGTEPVGFLQAFNLHRYDDTVARLVTSERLAAVAAQLLGCDRVRLYQSCVFVVRPSFPSQEHVVSRFADTEAARFCGHQLALRPEHGSARHQRVRHRVAAAATPRRGRRGAGGARVCVMYRRSDARNVMIHDSVRRRSLPRVRTATSRSRIGTLWRACPPAWSGGDTPWKARMRRCGWGMARGILGGRSMRRRISRRPARRARRWPSAFLPTARGGWGGATRCGGRRTRRTRRRWPPGLAPCLTARWRATRCCRWCGRAARHPRERKFFTVRNDAV